MFTGFPETTRQFFLELRYHNSAEWFNAHREAYQACVQAPFYSLIEDLTPAMLEIDPRMETRPYRLLARIRRDTRFTRDKSPYRDHLWIWFHQAAEPREQSVGYWFELGLDNVSWGLALWGDNRQLTERFRRELAAHPRRIGSLIRSCDLAGHGLALGGESFRRIEIPSGIPAWLTPWYRVKEPMVYKIHPDDSLVDSEAILHMVRADFQAMAPLYRLLRGIRSELDEEQAEAEAAAARDSRANDWEF